LIALSPDASALAAVQTAWGILAPGLAPDDFAGVFAAESEQFLCTFAEFTTQRTSVAAAI